MPSAWGGNRMGDDPGATTERCGDAECGPTEAAGGIGNHFRRPDEHGEGTHHARFERRAEARQDSKQYAETRSDVSCTGQVSPAEAHREPGRDESSGRV